MSVTELEAEYDRRCRAADRYETADELELALLGAQINVEHRLAEARAAVAEWDRQQLRARRGSAPYRRAISEARRTSRALEAAKRELYACQKNIGNRVDTARTGD